MVKLSIITINYNNKEGLYRTLESIRLQKCKDFEYIVIDGGSTDGSVELIKEYSEYIDYWVSEPDKGIYNAMNKGVAVAHGEYCQFLNSGDWLNADTTIEETLPFLQLDYDILCGNIIDAYEDGKRITHKIYKKGEITLFFVLVGIIPHQAAFIKTELLLKYPYDETFRIAGDTNFFLEVMSKTDIKSLAINVDIAKFDKTGISNTQSIDEERDKAIFNNIPKSLFKNICGTPSLVVNSFSRIPNSYTLKRFLVNLISLIVDIYAILRPSAVKPRQETGTQKLLKKNNIRHYISSDRHLIDFQ